MSSHMHPCLSCGEGYDCDQELGSCTIRQCPECEPKMATKGQSYCSDYNTTLMLTCTVAKGHAGPEHIAHDGNGEVVGRWPLASKGEGSKTCPSCDKVVSDDHVLTCDHRGCDDIECDDCDESTFKSCENCSKALCEDHQYFCQCCEVTVCEDCVDRHGT